MDNHIGGGCAYVCAREYVYVCVWDCNVVSYRTFIPIIWLWCCKFGSPTKFDEVRWAIQKKRKRKTLERKKTQKVDRKENLQKTTQLRLVENKDLRFEWVTKEKNKLTNKLKVFFFFLFCFSIIIFFSCSKFTYNYNHWIFSENGSKSFNKIKRNISILTISISIYVVVYCTKYMFDYIHFHHIANQRMQNRITFDYIIINVWLCVLCFRTFIPFHLIVWICGCVCVPHYIVEFSKYSCVLLNLHMQNA